MEAPDDRTSLSLLDRARADDPEAWRRLVHIYSPLVYSWGRRAGLNADDTADLMQDVFRSVAANVGKFRRDRPGDTFRGWLWTIARNKLNDFHRRASTQPVAVGGSTMHGRIQEVPDLEPEPCDDPSAAESHGGVLRRALELIRADFEESSWKAFWQTAVEGRNTADVARELGLSVFAVYQAKYRVQRKLRDELGDVLD
ncbi:MAG: sigma-70 family RNA polymerase sigma factor [Gemmataceae bacterium]|nr:sigma-70 family RNA polymerase sigma factor [Gemmataceae bacterium]